MTRRVGSGGTERRSAQDGDLIRARWAIDRLACSYGPTVRARAFWVYVGLLDHAEMDGSVRLLAAEFLPEFEMNRTSWQRYREVLERAGLIEVGEQGHAKPLRLLKPSV